MKDGFIPSHGGYEKLLSFQKARIVFDATAYFCDRYIDKRSRTHDQMVQAAVGQAEYFGDQPGKRDFEGECISLKSFCRPEAGRGPRLNLASFATNFAPFAVEDLTAKDAKVNAKDAEAHRALHS